MQEVELEDQPLESVAQMFSPLVLVGEREPVMVEQLEDLMVVPVAA
jgi:hypothetical protein